MRRAPPPRPTMPTIFTHAAAAAALGKGYARRERPARFFSRRGLTVLASEFVWVWLPSLLLAASAVGLRKVLKTDATPGREKLANREDGALPGA